jgi:tetratricopeptide (TPR) repeat protein
LTEPGPSAQRSERDSQILRALADRIDPRDAGAHNNLGVVYFKKRMLEEAIDAFERALQVDPRMGVAERNLRIAYCHDGYVDRLTAELEQRLTTDPEDGEARRRLARAYQRTGDCAAAIRHFSGLVERFPTEPQTTLALARAQSGNGDREGALRTIEAARARGVRRDPLSPGAFGRGAESTGEGARAGFEPGGRVPPARFRLRGHRTRRRGGGVGGAR